MFETRLVRSLTDQDSHFAMMPLAHIGEYTVECVMLAKGVAIGFWSGIREKAIEEVSILKYVLYYSRKRYDA